MKYKISRPKRFGNLITISKKELQDFIKNQTPIVKKGFIDWCFQINSKLVIKEAAILFESDSHIGLDAVICVVCPEEIRIERVIKRDNVNRSEVLSRIDQQMDVEKQKALSSYIIVNDGKHMVVPQVLDIIKEMG